MHKGQIFTKYGDNLSGVVLCSGFGMKDEGEFRLHPSEFRFLMPVPATFVLS
jgi:hypothetical protein